MNSTIQNSINMENTSHAGPYIMLGRKNMLYISMNLDEKLCGTLGNSNIISYWDTPYIGQNAVYSNLHNLTLVHKFEIKHSKFIKLRKFFKFEFISSWKTKKYITCDTKILLTVNWKRYWAKTKYAHNAQWIWLSTENAKTD